MSEDCMGILFSQHGGGCRWTRRAPKGPTGAATTIIVWRAKDVAGVSVPLAVRCARRAAAALPLLHNEHEITSFDLAWKRGHAGAATR